MAEVRGREVPFIPGEDLLRITWAEGDPKKGVFFQYIMRRVAYKDKDGKLVKTPRYDEFSRSLEISPDEWPNYSGACCNFFLCNIPDEKYGSIYDSLDDHQLIIPGPE